MYGRAGDLAKLNADRNNTSLPKIVRQRADKAHGQIVEQLKDRELMGLRERLIRAAQAHDTEAQLKIQMQMREHTGESRETGQ